MNATATPISTSSHNPQNEVTEEFIAENRLWTAVIVQAIEDWRSGTLRARREAQRFLFEDDHEFNRVCGSAGFDPNSLRSKLLKVGKKIAMQGPWTTSVAA
jgi:hypothetical protein